MMMSVDIIGKFLLKKFSLNVKLESLENQLEEVGSLSRSGVSFKYCWV